MIDTDVVQNNIATTLLHWFQPNLQMTGQPTAPSTSNSSIYTPPMVTLAVSGATQPPALGSASTPNSNAQTSYLGPSPPPGPPHRYVQALFAQPTNFSVPACFQPILTSGGRSSAATSASSTNGTARLGFDITQFIVAAALNPMPVAASFFRAQNPSPGSLAVSPTASALADAMCPGVGPLGAPAGMAAMGGPAAPTPAAGFWAGRGGVRGSVRGGVRGGVRVGLQRGRERLLRA